MMTFNLSQDLRRRPGKWSDPEMPISGWSCVDLYEDESSEGRLCEMCEYQRVHYVHVMRHENYGGELRCGCDCAGRLEENPTNAKQRERNYKNLQRRRQNWPEKSWGESKNGNPKLNVDGFVIVLVLKEAGWQIWIFDKHSERSEWDKGSFGSVEAAKLAAFDVMLGAKREWRENNQE